MFLGVYGEGQIHMYLKPVLWLVMQTPLTILMEVCSFWYDDCLWCVDGTMVAHGM